MMRKLTGVNSRKFILDSASRDSVLMTDEYHAYNIMNNEMERHAVKYKSWEYVSEDGNTHTNTNTIESFWALLERTFHGTHHHYSVKWLPMYVREACYKYNLRKEKDIFGFFMERVFA